jgi:electron transfer flavoprotein alpha subunit
VAGAWVFAEVTPDGPHPAALELLTHARSFDEAPAAIALGPGATAAATELGAYGAATVYTSDDPVFAEHPGRSAAHVLAGLVDTVPPDVVLFAQTYESRDVAGRLQGRIGSALMGNATSITDPRHARAEIFGGTKIVDVELAGPAPTLILLRPKSIAAEPTGGTARVVPLEADVPEDVRGARIVERHEEAASGPRLEDAKVVLAAGR